MVPFGVSKYAKNYVVSNFPYTVVRQIIAGISQEKLCIRLNNLDRTSLRKKKLIVCNIRILMKQQFYYILFLLPNSQDTCVALQALAVYSEQTAGTELNLKVTIRSELQGPGGEPLSRKLRINKNNALLQQSVDVSLSWSNVS